MNKTNTPFRYDYVGSFLRPAALKQARADFQSGRIDAAALKAVEDNAIRDLVAKQKAAGYHVITDGEFRRATWHLDFMWGFHGVGHTPTKTGLPFQGEAAMLDDTYLTGKVSVDEHPFVEHFRFVKALEDENTVAKLTIPAPAQFLEQMVMPFAMENTKRFYPSVQELMDDLAAGYRKVIADVYAAGCRNLQFDDCSWGMLVDPRACMIFDTDAKGLEEIKEQMLTVNNMAISGKPDDLVINTHVCRGNFHSTYASSGAYDSVAKTLLARENVNAYYLEFDDARSGGFEPLASVQELMDDLAAGYRKVIADVYAAGCRNLQFDDCSWGMLVDPRACMIFDTDAKGLEEIKEQMLTVNNMAISGKPDDLVINTHVCRGNFHSTYASSGAYDSVAKTLLARENVNAYYLEFDDARSGGFEPLASVSGEKKVVLGLVTTKRPELESKDAVIARIHEAAKYLPLDRLCLSPQCGFASCEIGNKLTEAQQWAKLALVKEIAEEVWG